jgi:DNA (cytosine-5)-methyltransferase 1
LTTLYTDNDPKVCAWMEALVRAGELPPGKVLCARIEDIDAKELGEYEQCHFFAGIGGWGLAAKLAGWTGPLWTGSCPCQPFSSAGKQRGTADERHVWPAFRELIAKRRPPAVAGEQVASPLGRAWLAGVRADLEALGYAVGAADLCAAGVGAPHIRQRLWWVAVSADTESKRAGAVGGGTRQGFLQSDGGGKPDALSNTAGRGQPEQRGACEPWNLRHADERGEAGGLGLATGIGPQGLQQAGAAGGPAQRARAAGGLPDAAHANGRAGDGREQGQAGLGRRGPSDRGPWDDFTIVHCADGKARRLVSRLGLLVDGISHTMASTLANERKVDATTTTSGPDQGVQIVQAPDDPQANRNSAGGSLSVSAPEVLQPGVYGGVDGGADQGSIAEEQPSPVNETPRVRLSDVRIGREPSRASQGRQPSQQRLIELGDVVRHLPHAYTLARMEGDHATAEALLGVYEACPSLGPVQHALQPLPSAWRPADRQEIQRAWEAGLFDRFGIIGCSPLVKHFPSRVTALKGLGNAIVPTLAAEFLMAVMETTIVNDGATQ